MQDLEGGLVLLISFNLGYSTSCHCYPLLNPPLVEEACVRLRMPSEPHLV